MTYQFGFELEGFFAPGGVVCVPPTDYPTDGFPGLVEIRTKGGADLGAALGNLAEEEVKWKNVTFTRTEHTFNAQDLKELRKRVYTKEPTEVENLYGKPSRLIGNKTLASFQINISNMVSAERQEIRDGKLFRVPAVYGLFDFAQIIMKLDKVFEYEITASKRQPGFYSIKDGCRLEYRSLPNFVGNQPTSVLIEKIKSCL